MLLQYLHTTAIQMQYLHQYSKRQAYCEGVRHV